MGYAPGTAYHDPDLSALPDVVSVMTQVHERTNGIAQTERDYELGSTSVDEPYILSQISMASRDLARQTGRFLRMHWLRFPPGIDAIPLPSWVGTPVAVYVKENIATRPRGMRYIQNSPSDTWLIEHFFKGNPNVQLLVQSSEGGVEMEFALTAMEYLNQDSLWLSFAEEETGQALLMMNDGMANPDAEASFLNPDTVWEFQHDLGNYPYVLLQVNEFQASPQDSPSPITEIHHIDANRLQVIFAQPQRGRVKLFNVDTIPPPVDAPPVSLTQIGEAAGEGIYAHSGASCRYYLRQGPSNIEMVLRPVPAISTSVLLLAQSHTGMELDNGSPDNVAVIFPTSLTGAIVEAVLARWWAKKGRVDLERQCKERCEEQLSIHQHTPNQRAAVRITYRGI